MIQFHGAASFLCDVLTYIHHGEGRYSLYLSDVTKAKWTVFTSLQKHILPEAWAAAEQYGKACCTEGEDCILRLGEE